MYNVPMVARPFILLTGIAVLIVGGLLIWRFFPEQENGSFTSPLFMTSDSPPALSGDEINYAIEPNPRNMTEGVQLRLFATGLLQKYVPAYDSADPVTLREEKDVGTETFQDLARRLEEIDFFTLSTDTIACLPGSAGRRLTFSRGEHINIVHICAPADGWPAGFPSEELEKIEQDILQLIEN